MLDTKQPSARRLGWGSQILQPGRGRAKQTLRPGVGRFSVHGMRARLEMTVVRQLAELASRSPRPPRQVSGGGSSGKADRLNEGPQRRRHAV